MKIKQTIKSHNDIEILGFGIKIPYAMCSEILHEFEDEIIYFAIDKNGDLWAYNEEPRIDKQFDAWEIKNILGTIEIDKLILEDVDWTQTCVSVCREDLK